MTKKEQILQMYFEEHKIQDMIAKSLGVSQSYISQVITNDERYCQEKEKRHNEAMERKAEYNKQYFKTYERHKKEDIAYQQLLALLKQDALELSYSGGNISDYDFAKWNLSAYHRDKNGNLVIDKKLKTSNDVPKKINMNIKVKPQRCLI